jgi:hypothetical protein
MNDMTNFNDFLNQMQSNDYRIRCHQGNEPDIPEMFLVSSPTMQQLYNQYGDVVCYDITYNLIKKRSSRKGQWGVGVFCVFGRNQ